MRFRAPDEGVTAFADLIRGEISVDNDTIEDFVLLRSNGTPTFLLANIVDDADMQITHVLRGEEHLNGTPKYLLLSDALGLGYRPVFAHLPLLVNEQRKKLSKRRDDVSVADYKARGFLPEAMRNYLALLGWGPPDGVEVRPIEEMVELFRIEDVNSAPALFDIKKLTHVNGEWIRRLDTADFVERANEFVIGDDERAALLALAPLAQERVKVLDELPEYFDWVHGPAEDPKSWDKAMKLPARRRRARRDHRVVRRRAVGARRAARAIHGAGRAARHQRVEGARPDPRRGHRSHRRPAAVRAARLSRTRRDDGAAAGGEARLA